jgi:flavin reductase (DIM6/NTAB) family NADH-FMN oxidoreductase RutF
MLASTLSADPAALPPIASYSLLVGAIVPRPIGFISTLSAEGVANLAPFSFFNAVCREPPVICFSVGNRVPPKDTIRNIRASGEFVANVVSEAIAERMNLCSGDYPAGISEFDISGLTPEPSEIVKPPCVRESPVNMECKVIQIVDVSARPAGASLVIGEIVRFHYHPSIMEGLRIHPAKLRAVGRMGGNEYTRTQDRFAMLRPKL